MRTAEEIAADLASVRAAKTRILAGQQVEEFRLHRREFRMVKITYADLIAEENRLLEEQQALTGEMPTFLISSFPGGPYR